VKFVWTYDDFEQGGLRLRKMDEKYAHNRDLCIHRTGILFSVWAFFGIHTRGFVGLG